MKTRTILIVTVAALAVLAVVGWGLRVAQPRPLARALAAAAPPVAPAPTPPASPPPAGAPQPLDEQRFIEISSSILIAVAPLQDKPDAKELIPGVMEKVLKDAGVTEEEFAACAQRVYADPKHAKVVGDAILARVQQRTSPEMRRKVADLATAMSQAQARGQSGSPPAAKGAPPKP
jgi:hypothetical protein